MPKIVDGEARREQIADAMWRIVASRGMGKATVRAVAQESGLSVGAVQHYFKTQGELVHFAVDVVVKRVRERIDNPEALAADDPAASVSELLLQLVPLDEERLAESRIWLAFLEESLLDERFASAREEVEGLIASVPRGCLDYLEREGLLRKGVDKDLESRRLAALLDGLTVRLVGGFDSEKARWACTIVESQVRLLIV